MDTTRVSESIVSSELLRSTAVEACPQNCPCQFPRPGIRSHQQPSRLIEEVIERQGFARKNEHRRNADRRLANRRLQPLGHLTAKVKCN